MNDEYNPADEEFDSEYDPQAELDGMFPDGIDDGVSIDTIFGDN